MQIRTNLVVTRDAQSVELTIVGDYSPGMPAHIAGRPEDSHPGELPEAEVTHILLDEVLWAGRLTQDEEQEAISAIISSGDCY